MTLIITKLVDVRGTNYRYGFLPGTFRGSAATLEADSGVASTNALLRLEFFRDEIEAVREIDLLTGEPGNIGKTVIYPVHYVSDGDNLNGPSDVRDELRSGCAF